MQSVVMEKTMGYETFVKTMKEVVWDKLGDGYEVRIIKVIKNNSLELDSLVALKEGKKFAPNIYLMPYYESYLSGTPLITLVDRLCNIYRHCSVPVADEELNYTLKDMKSFIFFRLVSFERNEMLLEKIPHVKFLDLAVTFHCLVRNDDEGIGSIRITNEHLAQWNLSMDELQEFAVMNTKRLFPATIKSMEEVLKGVCDELILGYGDGIELPYPFSDLSLLSKDTNRLEMYILTNQKGINGASCMIYEDVIRGFADRMNSDLYILPSSIHEIILIPKEKEMQKESLSRMVKDVNRTQVAVDEILSDKVYLYSRKQNAILM